MIGDRRYGITNRVGKVSTHPNARASGTSLQGSLASGYSFAQQNPRFLGSWSPVDVVPTLNAATDTTQLRLFDGNIRVLEYFTHIRAAFIFGAAFEVGQTSLSSSIVNYNISIGGTWTSQISDTVSPESASFPAGSFLRSGYNFFSRSIEVEVSPTSSQDAEALVYLTRGSANSRFYILHSCVIMGECRG